MLIALDHVTKFYEVVGEKCRFKNVSLVISEGDFVGIMGRSGSGKSTLVNLIGFLDKQFSGDYYLKIN
jgi:putative ABC transport system ATP-binding protein